MTMFETVRFPSVSATLPPISDMEITTIRDAIDRLLIDTSALPSVGLRTVRPHFDRLDRETRTEIGWGIRRRIVQEDPTGRATTRRIQEWEIIAQWMVAD